jgi:hypothetical protein
MAASIARVFATTSGAFVPLAMPSSARAIALADAVRFSILEDAADSDRNSSAVKGAMWWPTSVSKRTISAVASSASAWTELGSETVASAMSGVMAAW